VNTTTDVVNGLVTGLASGDDTSIQAHVDSVVEGLRFVAEHPLGVGLGTAVPRFGSASSPGESALFEVGADIGLLGLLLFLALYGGLVLAGFAIAWRRREEVATCALGAIVGVGGLALLPVVLSSQVWSDFSVTFLFWWAAGSVVTALAGNRGAAVQMRRGVD
jgi:O-antigen ligase